MNKKIIFSLIVILILIVAAAGFFWWQESQKDVRELNKDLPEGVRVVKSFFGKEYKIINKIDGYEFGVPEEWKGIKEIKYHEEERGKEGITGLSLEGFEGKKKEIGIISYKLAQIDVSLEDWVKEQFQKFKLSEVIKMEKKRVGNFELIQVKAEKYFPGFVWCFFKENLKIYEIDGVSEEFIREITLNGKW